MGAVVLPAMIRLEAGGLSPYRFSFAQPVTTSKTTYTQRCGTFLWLRDSTGRRGWGEAAPLAGHSVENESDATRALQRVLHAPLPGLDEDDAALSVTHWLARFEPLPASARFALETALLDLLARARGVPLHQLLRSGRAKPVLLSGLLGGADGPALDARAEQLHASGILTWKVKLSAAGLTQAQSLVLQRWRQRLGRQLVLRADANGSLDAATLSDFCRELAPWDFDYLEQPLPVGEMDRVPHRLALPIAADEELRDAPGVERALSHPAVRVLVIKPALAGGIVPALSLVRRARAAGKQVVITHMLEAEVAFAAACELALAIDPTPPACGLVPLAIDDCSVACQSLPQHCGSRLEGDGYVGLGTAPE